MANEVTMMQAPETGRARRFSRLPALAALCAVAAVASAGFLGGRLRAQEPAAALEFEVASVKPNKSGDGFIRFGLLPGGRFNALNVPARQLIVFAYAPM